MGDVADDLFDDVLLVREGNYVCEDMCIEDLDLWVRSYNALKRYGVNFVDDLCEMTKEDVRKIRHIEVEILANIEEALGKAGLSLKEG